MPLDLSERIKQINQNNQINESSAEEKKPSIAEALNSASPRVTEVAERLDKEIEDYRANIVPLPYIKEETKEPKKVIKNDWQQPAMFYVDFLMRMAVAVCAFFAAFYLLRLLFWS